MKRFLFKALCFFLPLAALQALELVLPVDAFSFRVWESLYVLRVVGLPPGRFYPDTTVEKVEQGDLAPYTPFAVDKHVVWQTDRYGFRQVDREESPWPVVIVGDSAIVGTSLTQADMLGQALERQLGQAIYSYAPFDVNKFAADPRFHAQPPDTLVFAIVERGIPTLPRLRPPRPEDLAPDPAWKAWLKANSAFKHALIGFDRLYKGSLLNFVRGRIKASVMRWTGQNPVARPRIGNLVFFEGAYANRKIADEELEQAVSRLREYRDYFAARNVRFIFVGIPNKENFYADLFPEAGRPLGLPQLIERLRRAGLETVDLQSPYEVARAQGEVLYHADDSHWNARGAEIAAQEIARVVSPSVP